MAYPRRCARMRLDVIDLEQQLPKPSRRHIALHVKPAAERAIRRGHPWQTVEDVC